MLVKLIDTHTHTSLGSPDAQATLREHCLAARERGLGGLVLTDHCDTTGWDFAHDYYDLRRDSSYALVRFMRDEFPDLYVGFGAELGEWYFDHAWGDAIANDARLDFLLGSLHTLDGTDFYQMKYESAAHCDELLAKYAVELYDHCANSPLDSLAHLTYPLRYMRKAGFDPDFSKQRDVVAEALRALIDRGAALEINSSGLRQGMGETLPGREWLELYRDLGGRRITLGSDAHFARDLGSGLSDAAELAKSVGFESVCYYVRRQPVELKLD